MNPLHPTLLAALLMASSTACASDFPSDILLQISPVSASAQSTMPDEDFKMSCDGNAATMYHSDYRGVEPPLVMTWKISGGKLADYLIYTPRSDGGSNGNIGSFTLRVKDGGSGEFRTLGGYDFAKSGSPTRIDFSPPLKDLTEVQFLVNTAAGDASRRFFVNVAEVGVYQRSSGSAVPLSIFTDNSCTRLQSGVRQQDIDKCKVPLYRQIAAALMDKDYEKYAEFRVGRFCPYYSPALDAERNKTAQYGVMENPAGISVSAGEELIVMADGIPPGQSAALKVQALAAGYGKGPVFMLTNGANKITIPSPIASRSSGAFGTQMPTAEQGLLYVQYQINSTEPLPACITLHFAQGGKVNGYYDSRRHSRQDYERLLNVLPDEENAYFDVKGKYAMATFKKQAFRKSGGRGRDFIDALDTVVWLEWKFAGLLPPPLGYGGRQRSHAYFVNLPMAAGIGAYASDYHTAYPDGGAQSLCTLGNLLNEDGEHPTEPLWAFGHELGHVNQLRPALKWGGMTEVTNNLYSMYVQTRLNEYFPASKSTRQTSRLWLDNVYSRAMNFYFASADGKPRPAYNGRGRDVWFMLAPLWQLHLYLSDVLGKGSRQGAGVYADVYEHFRRETSDGGRRTSGEHQLEFVRQMCRLSQLNLEKFFGLWGFLTPTSDGISYQHVGEMSEGQMSITQAQIDEVLKDIRQYPAPAAEFEYITDMNIDLYKSPKPIVRGEPFVVSGGSIERLPDGWDNAVAVELRSAAGELKYVLLRGADQHMPASLIAEGDKLFATGANGERVEAQVLVK